jgi:hypothetical protein
MAGFSCQARTCVRSAAGGGSGGGATGGGAGGGATGGGTATGGGAGGGATGGGTGGGVTGGGTGGGATGGGSGNVSCSVMNPPTIQINFPTTCPSPTPCGGNPTSGTFFYTEACIAQDEFQSVVSRIESVCGAGNVQITGYDGGLAGHATFVSGTNLCRTVRGNVTVSASIRGSTCASSTLCGIISGGLAQGGFTGSCGLDAGTCDCLVSRAIDINNAGVPYTTNSTSLTVTNSNQVFETCLNGTTFSTRELDAGMATHEPGTAVLTRQ